MAVLYGCNQPQVRSIAQIKPGKYFSVTVEQDGRPVPIDDHTAYIHRRPFTLVFAMRNLDAVMVNASFSPKLYVAARDGKSLGSVLPLEGRGMAEDLFNVRREIFIRDDGYHFWHYYGPKNHRFDSVERVENLWICRRTIERCLVGRGTRTVDLSKMSQRGIYLVFTKTAWDKTTKKRVEKQTERLRILFR